MKNASYNPPVTNETKSEPEKPAAKTLPEFGGPKGPEPTRYGDWELKGKCVDF